MTPSIALVLAILVLAIILFITEKLRVDLVALMVMLSLTLTGVISGTDAIRGFGNPTVIAIASVLVLSGGLTRTGVAHIVGQRVLHYGGSSPTRLLVVMMLTAGLLSSIMVNIAVTALLLPVVLDIARRTGQPPSTLLMPLAFASLLGGILTLVGTTPNLLINGALVDEGMQSFRMFDFTPVGATVLVVGVAYMALVGRRLLPRRDTRGDAKRPDLKRIYRLGEVLRTLEIPANSALAGRTLAQSQLGSVLGLSVIGLVRGGQLTLAPDPGRVLQARDRLLACGRLDRFRRLQDWKHLVTASAAESLDHILTASVRFARVELTADSAVTGRTVREAEFRRVYGVHVLAVSHGRQVRRTRLGRIRLEPGDRVVVTGPPEAIVALRRHSGFVNLHPLTPERLEDAYHLERHLQFVEIPEGSLLSGKSLRDSRLGETLELTVLAIVRRGQPWLLPDPEAVLQDWDLLLVQAPSEDLALLRALQEIEVSDFKSKNLDLLESDTVGMVEAALSPRTKLAGKSVREVRFRERYGLSILGIWRDGRVHDTGVADERLRLGDAFLVYGPGEKLSLLAEDPDFYVLDTRVPEVQHPEKAPVSTLIMVGMLVSVVSGLLPIHVAGPLGATLMVLTGCLKMEDAYHFIDMKTIVLIAGMLSLGLAMRETGAAQLVARTLLVSAAHLGPTAVIAALFLLTALAAQVMPTAAVAVLISPVALHTAKDLGMSAHSLLMVVVVSCSCSFMSPVGHPANLLVMGFGGYRFSDYTRVGLPLTLLALMVVLLLVPRIWPLH
jgi:di/tricarboxylate transporter